MNIQDDWDEEDEEDFAMAISQRTEELYRVPNHETDRDGVFERPGILPLRDLVVFPRMVSPVFVDNDVALLTLRTAQKRNQTVIALTQKDPEQEQPKAGDFLSIGVEIAVGRLLTMPDGNSSALVQGRRRVQILEFTRLTPYLKVRARVLNEPTKADKQTQALMRSALNMFARVVELNRAIPEEAHLFALNIQEPGWLADMIATSISVPFEERQKLLLLPDPKARLERVNELLADESGCPELEEDIHNKVQSEVDKSQRESYLREQMKAIQTELGEGDVCRRADVNELRQKVEQAKLPEEARKTALREIERLNQMPPMARRKSASSARMWNGSRPAWHPSTPKTTWMCGARRQNSRPRPLRAAKGQRPHSGIHRRAFAQAQEGTPAHSMLCWAARHGQDLAGALDCRSAGAQVRARFAGRRA